jgi:hypothetical protein
MHDCGVVVMCVILSVVVRFGVIVSGCIRLCTVASVCDFVCNCMVGL